MSGVNASVIASLFPSGRFSVCPLAMGLPFFERYYALTAAADEGYGRGSRVREALDMFDTPGVMFCPLCYWMDKRGYTHEDGACFVRYTVYI
jgi:hypothetical protein